MIEHHHAVEIKDKTRYIGIVLTTVGWSLYALFTVALDVLNPHFYQHVSEKTVGKIFFEFAIMHFSMCLLFFVCCISKGVKFLRPKDPLLIHSRSIFAVISFWCYSFARIWNSTIDNSLQLSTDAIWVLIILLFLSVRIRKISKLGIFVGFIGILFVYLSDLKSFYDFLGGILGSTSGFTLAVITVITAYLIKQDPPIRIGLYQGATGFLLSSIVAIVLGLTSGWDIPSFREMVISFSTGLIFAALLYWIWKAFYYTEAHILGALSYILPVFLIFIGWLLNQEPMNLPTIIGTIIITCGGLLVVIDSHFTHSKTRKNIDR